MGYIVGSVHALGMGLLFDTTSLPALIVRPIKHVLASRAAEQPVLALPPEVVSTSQARNAWIAIARTLFESAAGIGAGISASDPAL